MAAVTQSISNFLGGVSSQPDEKKSPGQVNDIINGYPDPTFGLTKRNGTQFLVTLDTYDENNDPLKDASWFFINRDQTESYFGCVTTKGDIRIWNAITRTEATVTYEGTAKDYLGNGLGNGDFVFTTIQDLTYVINKTKEVEEKAVEPYVLGRHGTIILKEISNKQEYTVYINGVAKTYTSPNFPDTEQGQAATDADTMLTGIKNAIGNTGGITCKQLADSLELYSDTPFTLDVKAGITGRALESYQDDIGNSARLARNSVEGRLVKIVNTTDERSSYFVQFVADQREQAQGGSGYYKEARGWDTEDDVTSLAPEGLVSATMPHQLINTAVNEFTFSEVTYENRLVGNLLSNSSPSFVGATINEGFLHSNRLGFLSNENVILSQSGEFTNFYFVSAQTVIDSDPIDLNCSSIRPAQLFAVIPQTQGLILFSKFEQFKLFSDDAALTATDSIIRSISNYEADSGTDPVDVGTSIIFLSKTPVFTRTMAMTTRGNNANPVIVDIGKVASEYVPDTIDNLVASPQNSFVAMSSQDSNEVFFYRFFNTGEKDIMQAWFKWNLPGTTQSIAIAQDMILFVTKDDGEYTLLGTSIAQQVLRSSSNAEASPRLDKFFPVTETIVYDSTTRTSTIKRPYVGSPDLTPVMITTPIVDTTRERVTVSDISLRYQVNNIDSVEGGSILPVTVVNGEWTIPGDWTGYENKMIGGFKYDFEVILPTTYFRADQMVDYTANLTISRYKFSVGETGLVQFQSKAYGSDAWEMVNPVIDANYYNANNVAFTNSTLMTVPIYQKNIYFDFKVISDSPIPVSLNSMMWEGQYSPRYYRRT
jgi:hypothetical protein